VVVLSGAFEEEPGAVPEGPNITAVRGHVRSLADYYRAADAYVFPIADAGSVIGVPMSIVEALANELPVVAVRSPMVERWSKADGVVLVDSPVDVPDAARRVHGMQVPASVVPPADLCAGDLVTCGGNA
jgi:glycosyltransferase involved in cell wall biosynthesis